MAESVLSKLVQTDKDTQKHLESLDKTVQSIYGLQKKVAKMEETERKRNERDSKRKKADKGIEGLIQALKKEKEDKKKDDKKFGGIGKTLKQMLTWMTGGALAKLLISALGGIGNLASGGAKLAGKAAKGLFGGLFGPKGLFGKIFGKQGLLATGFGKLFGKKGLGRLFGKIGGKGLLKGLKLGGIFTGLISGVMTYFESGDWLKAVTVGLGAGGGSVVGGLLGSIFGPIGTVAGAAIGGIIGDWVGKYVYEKFPKFFAPIKKVGDDIGNFLVGIWEWMKPFFEGVVKGATGFFEELKETFRLLKKIGSRFMNFLKDSFKTLKKNIIDPAWNFLTDKFKILKVRIINPMVDLLGKMWNSIKTTLQPAIDFLGGVFDTLGKQIKKWFGFLFSDDNKRAAGEAVGGGPARFALNLLNKALSGLAGEGYQTGGVINVPGTGSGDKVPALLAPGSFVMNRNAVGGYQNGGIPAMLEPGEKVYSPGSWGPAEMMMNSAIPRFQSGGPVQSDHPDTGPGWSVGTDAQGRPAIFSQGGAEAFMKMIKASDGAVKASDINSAQRSPSKNAAVGGVSNSNHLYGNGVDVQSGSSSWNWMRSNSGQYGWNWNDYLGPTGWHWDYTGKNGGTDIPQGPETEIKQENRQGLPGIIGDLGNVLGGFGGAAAFATKAMGALISGLGSGLAGALGLGSIASMMGGQPSSNGAVNQSGTSSVGGAKGNEVEVARNLMKDLAITKAQAAGIVGNLSYESAGLSPDIREGMTYGNSWEKGRTNTPAGYGWAQWSFDRHDKFVNKHLGGFGGAGGGSKKVATPQDNYNYLLEEIRGPEPIKGMPANNVKGATHWFRKEWERAGVPADGKRMAIAEDTYAKLQTGGVANMRGTTTPSSSRYQKAQEEFAQAIADAQSPIVIPMPVGGGGGGSSGGNSLASATNQPPSLPEGPSSIQSAEYFYRLNMGSAF